MSHPQCHDALSAGEFDCALCLKLLFDPVTASCGHSFCKRCAHELISSFASAEGSGSSVSSSSSASLRCPICRASLDRRWVPAPSIALGRLLCLTFPLEYKARETEDISLNEPLSRLPHASVDAEGRKVLPLFVLDSILPGQKMLLHVFEIHYRLLVQRALGEHSRRFGMVGFIRSNPTDSDSAATNTSGGIADVGTEVEIVSCLELPDGRFRLEVEGRSIFKVVDRHLRDGYWEASVEVQSDFFDNASQGSNNSNPEEERHGGDDDEGGEEVEEGHDDDDGKETLELAQYVIKRYERWEELVRSNSWERHPLHLQEVKHILGPIPQPDQPGRLSVWAAAAINPLPPLGVAKEIRPAVLAATDNLERLRIVSDALDESINTVWKKRGTIELFGLEVDVQILLFGVFGLVVGALVQNYCRRMFVK